MTLVPLPDVPCVRVRLIYNEGAVGEGGNRFYIAYGGTAPTGANCTTLAGDIAAAWNTRLASAVDSGYSLEEVDVLDIATDSGLSGQWNGTHTGTDTSGQLPVQTCQNIEFGIARRYRGGKPRMYLPPAGIDALHDQATWDSAHLAAINTAVGEFFSDIAALSIGAMGTLKHVNLSYYKGFHNVTNSSGRERAVPTYRDTALHDDITGYFAKAVIGSQRRRRTSTTP